MFDNLHEFRYKEATCEVDVDQGVGYVTRVYSKVRASGHATGLLRLVVAWADENDLVLRLHARGYGGPVQTMLDNNQLAQFYKKFGFEVDPDHEVELGTMMVRSRRKNTHYDEREN